ncbi:MAG: AAA family ATPase, partial [gamma proteobacterium symbiont of Bathyaustriella thionipta]|nr:AAA family ATPase [gamma proteobacterium symbiont of Bathyaustriella thionipta]MCU7951612.1 AAA family ATPase [gamma proteobacterium symbiont of Bathyaustriella thionipta]MCU7953728.1 AAA family ATPase [gamma proteobacterium symbiont of Bathyaustriella thionipta]MCU7958209.1 AAA family ATPase [gamma proteobacterium symbiont of Bathyaustriella thionipta]MCU7968760.1 AAA family ATPase [gamma proteobacterium symbiont of Bathyaustriella thionipta]
MTMGNGRKLRLLSAYHLDSIMPITSSDHIGYFLKIFDFSPEEIPPASQPIARLLKLTEVFEAAKNTFNEKLTSYGFINALYSDELNIRPVTRKPGLSKSDNENHETLEKNDMVSLNSILYGPPGTGKTYSTTEQSVQMAEPEWFEELLALDLSDEEFRNNLKQKYDQLVETGRIVFTTFHQSFAYEDFIEGIRANTNEETNEIQYTIEEGVFKKIAEEANRSISGNDTLGLSASPKVWKISIGRRHESELRNRYIQNGEARIGWNLTGDLSLDYDERTEEEQAYWDSLKNKSQASITNFSQNVEAGDVFLCLNDATTVEAIGIVTSDYFYEPNNNGNEDKHYAHARKVNWLFTGIEFNILPINKQKRLVQQTFYPLNRISWNDINSELQNQNFSLPALQEKTISNNIKPNYVIIIDEINRGNIARIFGELITLLEPDKRRGGKDARSVVLPYSKQESMVPENLYVLGTMNTADKSLEQLDLALRRRFEFIELLPQPQLLNDIDVFDCARCQPTCRIFLNLSLWGLCPQTPKVFLQG